MRTPFFERLERAQSVLLLGCGGGYDFVGAIPIAHHLKSLGKDVSIGNVSFSRLADACRRPLGQTGWVIGQDCGALSHCPEKVLEPFLKERGYAREVFGFTRCGPLMMRDSLQAAIDLVGADALVLIDGGTDAIMKGDESNLATIEEDAVSIVAGTMTTPPVKLIACLGFGVEAGGGRGREGGVCHHHFLENTAELIRSGGFLGCSGITREMPEGRAFLDAVQRLQHADLKTSSIIQTSIARALEGRFGDVHSTHRTHGSELFINPLMTTYWTYGLEEVAAAMGFRDDLAKARTHPDAEHVIRAHHAKVQRRTHKPLPL